MKYQQGRIHGHKSLLQLGIIETIRFNRRAIETIGFNRFNRNFKRELTTEKVHHAKSQTWSS